jgi:hypothetical protein
MAGIVMVSDTALHKNQRLDENEPAAVNSSPITVRHDI